MIELPFNYHYFVVRKNGYMNTNKRLLLIGFVWPEPNSSAAGGRMMQLIALFQNQGFAITFASPAQDSDFMVNLADYDVDKVSIALNDSNFDLFIKENKTLFRYNSRQGLKQN